MHKKPSPIEQELMRRKPAEDEPGWDWRTQGNRKRGVTLKDGSRRVVGPSEYDRLRAAGKLNPSDAHDRRRP